MEAVLWYVLTSSRTTGGDSVTVHSVTLPGGYVTIHGGTVTDGQGFESVRHTSASLASGIHQNVTATLDEPVIEDTTRFRWPTATPTVTGRTRSQR